MSRPAISVAISVVICTHNRAWHLGRALDSLARQTLPPAAFEVLVVDNGCTDDTPGVAARAGVRLPTLRYVREPRLGLSRARNTGWREAAAPLVAYLDDDAVAEPGWLAALVAGFADARQPGTQPGTVGGPIRGDWEAPRPPWLHRVLLPALTVIDWGPAAFIVAPPAFLAGANIAFRRELLAAAGGFSESLGRKGKLLLSAEERDMTRRIEALGHPTLYVPDAAVKHWVGKERLTPAWFLDRARWQGVSEALADLGGGDPGAAVRQRLAARRLRQPQVLKNRLLAGLGAGLGPGWPGPLQARGFVARYDIARADAYAATLRHGPPAEAVG